MENSNLLVAFFHDILTSNINSLLIKNYYK